MNKVYIVLREIEYSGDQLLSVHATEQGAEKEGGLEGGGGWGRGEDMMGRKHAMTKGFLKGIICHH